MKIIIFNVIAYKEVGLGHLYRALTLASNLNTYQVILFCENKSLRIIRSISKKRYKIITYKKNNLLDKINRFKPALVINDILDTTQNYMKQLRMMKIKTLNFEDLGNGSRFANLVINELYDKPANLNKNVLWGHEYFCLRDEFLKKKPNKWGNKVKNLLVTFGGTDQHNLTSKVIDNIINICNQYKIKIFIVTGAGYTRIKSLQKKVDKLNKINSQIFYTHASGVISEIMSKCDIAITSNGRTVYELAEMNIPSIVISQHKRENTHLFAHKKNGFIPIGVFKGKKSMTNLRKIFLNLISDNDLRKDYYNKIKKTNFKNNKKNVLKIIKNLINEKHS